MYWPEFEREQLFDLANDPHEENDLVSSQVEQLNLMRERFHQLRKQAQGQPKTDAKQ